MQNRNYKILQNKPDYCLIGDLSSNDKFHFYYKYNGKGTHRAGKKRKIIFIIIGMSLIFLTLFFKITIPEFHDNLYDKYFTPYYATNINRSEIQDNRLQKVCQFINYGKYDSAVFILNKYDKKDMSAHFYLGMLYQKKGKYDSAILEYKIVINNNNNLFIEQSHWYIGLCYLKKGDRDNYISHFKILSEKNDGFYKLKSQIILIETK